MRCPRCWRRGGERSPVIFVTGSSTLKRQGAGGFKEIDDVAIAAPLVKYSVQITDGERISEFVDRAWTAATTGYPGPVHLSLPVDIMFLVLRQRMPGCEERPFDRAARPVPRAWPDPQRAGAHVLKALVKRREAPGDDWRPWYLVGGRRRTGWPPPGQGRLRMPVFNVPYHTKLLGEECEAYMGLADFHQYHPSKPAIHEADLVLMVGGRLDNQMNFGNPPFIPRGTNP